MSKNNNTTLVALLGIGALGIGAYALMNKSNEQQSSQPQQPQISYQPVYYPQQSAQPAASPSNPAPAKPSVVEKAGSIVNLLGKGVDLVSDWFRKGINGLGATDAGYYYDQNTHSVVVTDPELYQEVVRQMKNSKGVDGLMM